MAECMISWVIIVSISYLWGYAGLRCLTYVNGRLAKTVKEDGFGWKIDDCIVAGLCMLTVYAQAFSLFYKVGAVALLSAAVAGVIFLLVYKTQMIADLKKCVWHEGRMRNVNMVIVCIMIGVVVLKLTSLPTGHPDTSLYHAQSIHWIEECGAVKGLGNLHNRMAYNSAFFCLQALFSFSFVLGKSLHTVNGLIAAVFVCYAVCSARVWKSRRASVSDFVRLGLIAYLVSAREVFSSPGSDLLAVGLVIYIACKWISYQEDKEDKILPYTELCFLAVWAVSVKLSASVIVFLAVYPAVRLLKGREWKQIMLDLLIGIVIIVPFLARNVIISGYLVYPYPELDLFDVDWKMLSYTLLFDRNEITAWGRGLRDVRRFDESIRVWFPVWYKTLGILKKWWWISIAGVCVLMVKSICQYVSALFSRATGDFKTEEALRNIVIVFTMTGCMLVWFIGAPLPRYGGGYLYMLAFWGIGELVMSLQKKLQHIRIESVCFAFMLGLLMNPFCESTDIHFLRVPDYDHFRCEEVVMGQYTFYKALETSVTGYWNFPSAQYGDMLDKIELRGDTICEGFRVKEEYKGKFIPNNGSVHDVNMFDDHNEIEE